MADTPAAKTRVLFVDDEDSIRLTMPRILEMHGYDVTVAGTVPEALAAIHAQPFDVLLADLNVGQPGDGFTVVSAMRRTQPSAVSLILTGYPAFDGALEAIRRQVDGYVVKPTDIETLIQTIETKIKSRTPHQPIAVHRIAALLAANGDELSRRWVRAVKTSDVFAGKPAPSSRLRSALEKIQAELLRSLGPGSAAADQHAVEVARAYGRERRQANYSIRMLLEENHLLRRITLELVQENLLAVEISFLVSDLARVNNTLDMLLAAAVEGYLEQ